jgi:hypothetical protein
MAGEQPEDNPFDAFESAEHFSAWQHGYRMEKQYWEDQNHSRKLAEI